MPGYVSHKESDWLERRLDGATRTPAKHIHAQGSAKRPTLQEEVGRKLSAEVGDVEDGRQPRILLADQPGVLAQAEDGLRAERRLVRLLDAVAEPHERQKVPVDLAQQLLVLLVRVVRLADHVAVLLDGHDLDVVGRGGLLLVHDLLVAAAGLGERGPHIGGRLGHDVGGVEGRGHLPRCERSETRKQQKAGAN